MRLYPIFSWQSFWVGFRWDSFRQRLQINPVPMFGIVMEFGGYSERSKNPSWWTENAVS
jgi:hypothetical protein